MAGPRMDDMKTMSSHQESGVVNPATSNERVSAEKAFRGRRNRGASSNDFRLRSAVRVGAAYVSGGVGKAADRATRAVAGRAVDTGAQRAANYLRSRRAGQNNATATVRQKKKMHTTGFYMIVGIAVLKDIVDIIADATVILSVVSIVTTLVVGFIVALYFYYIDVKPSSRKVVAWLISLVVDLIPILSVVPTYSASLFLIRWMENGGSLSTIARRFTGKRRMNK